MVQQHVLPKSMGNHKVLELEHQVDKLEVRLDGIGHHFGKRIQDLIGQLSDAKSGYVVPDLQLKRDLHAGVFTFDSHLDYHELP